MRFLGGKAKGRPFGRPLAFDRKPGKDPTGFKEVVLEPDLRVVSLDHGNSLFVQLNDLENPSRLFGIGINQLIQFLLRTF